MTGNSPRWLVAFSAFVALFPEFQAPSWRAWRSIGAVLFGETPEDPAFVAKATERTRFDVAFSSFFAAAGRGGGKTRFMALIAAYFAVGRVYQLAPGENVYIAISAVDLKQAGIALRYIVGLLKSVPTFAGMIVRETERTVELNNGLIIETGAADFRAVRSRSVVLAFVDEGAFLPTDDSARPDAELVRALRPALGRVPGSLLVFVSSPWAQRGELYRAFAKHFGKDDSTTLVMRATTAELNPLFSQTVIAEAHEDDPTSAENEYGAQFRRDLESFLALSAIEAVVVRGCHERPYDPRYRYTAFLDFAGGSGQDSATLAIAHVEGETAVLDAVREVQPPFSPEQTCREFADVCLAYHVVTATADHWGGQFPAEAMRKLGVTVQVSEKTKSELYRELLPMVNSGRIELLEHPRLISQLSTLERRVARGGRDSIDHQPGGHDDVANAVAGACVVGAAPQPVSGNFRIVGTAYSVGPSSSIDRYTPLERARLIRLAEFGGPYYEADPVHRHMKAIGKLPMTLTQQENPDHGTR